MLKNDFDIYCLRKNYDYMHKLLNKLQQHTYRIYSLYIINTTEKNLLINELYEISTNLNLLYNSIIHEYNQDDSIEDRQIIIKYATNYDIVYNLIIDNYIKADIPSEIPIEIIYPIKHRINSSMLELINKIGFTNIEDFYDYINVDYKVIKCFEHFLPLKITIGINKYDVTDLDRQNMNDSNYIINEQFVAKRNLNPPDEIFVPYINIYITYKENYLIQGVFLNDYLNLNTRIMSQVIYPDLYEKKRLLNELVGDNDFKQKYIKYCDMGELIILSNDEWIQLLDDYNRLFNKIKDKSFSALMNYFANKTDSPIDIFNIVKVLLLGSDEQINIAGMLFLVLKEKKTNNIMISDIIYTSLNYVSQIKLKMVNININEEMKKLSEFTYDDIDLKKQLFLTKHMPQHVKYLVNEKLNELKLNNNDYYKQHTFAKTLIDFPWPNPDEKKFRIDANNVEECANYLNEIEINLNKTTYGHNKVKERIILYIAECIANPDAPGCIMSFFGPPGVGKTLLAQSLAEALDIPIIQISLGGHNDGELLHGIGYAYSSSQPGTIIKEIIRAGTTRCILYLDELDKTSTRNSKSHNEIESIISQLADPNMNSAFNDRFFQGINFPLKNLIIISSYNKNDSFESSLLNRFDEITIKPYNIREKIYIVQNFVINELCNSMNFEYDINISDDILKYILETYTKESGIREIKRKIKIMISKLNRMKLLNHLDVVLENGKINIDLDLVHHFLCDETIYEETNVTYDQDEIGIVNAMYATIDGNGGIITIQIEKNFDFGKEFSFKYTGLQSELMKESVQCAYTSAISYIMTLEKYSDKTKIEELINLDYPHGFHIHVGNLSSSKDGSSAGCAFALLFISLILNKPIRNNIAITGELDIKNNILSIGGIDLKVTNAKNNSTINTVIIPFKNENDLVQLFEIYPDLFDDKFSYKTIDTLADAVDLCLVH